MFANPVWSLLILWIPVLIYFFIIRPRLKANLVELYAHVDGFWARVAARVYAFRTVALGTMGAILIAAPDLLVQVSSLDFSFLPQPWPMYVSLGFMIVQVLMKAYETKPKNEQPPP